MEPQRTSAPQERRKKPALLLVDDDSLIVESLRFVLEEEFTVFTAATRAEVKACLQRLRRVPALALIDLGLPPTVHLPDEGFALVGELLAINRGMKILVLSGQSTHANIQHALTLGAVDFLPKPCDTELLKARLRHQCMMLEAEQLRLGTSEHGQLVGTSAPIETLRILIKRFADTPFPILIQGESGVGKELVAERLHYESARAVAPFMTINCAAYTAELLESQLFGHAKGAFTGAAAARAGFFEDAGAGSLFLDEVGEMPLTLQAKLLRVLENGEFYRLGETHARRSSARVIAATNRDLKDVVRRGEFRQDLYYRLSVLTLQVPPLRERGDDIQLLLDRFRQIYCTSQRSFTLHDKAMDLLESYGYPGNVRELRNIVIRLSAKYPGQCVSRAELEAELETGVIKRPLDDGDADAAAEQQLRAPGFRLDESLDAYERRYIQAALRLGEGNLSQAARLLGINRTTLYSRMQRLGLDESH